AYLEPTRNAFAPRLKPPVILPEARLARLVNVDEQTGHPRARRSRRSRPSVHLRNVISAALQLLATPNSSRREEHRQVQQTYARRLRNGGNQLDAAKRRVCCRRSQDRD